MATIQEFVSDSMEDNPQILIIGKRGSGKSFLVRDLMYHCHCERKDISCGAIIAPTDRFTSFYKTFFPDLYIHYNLDQIDCKAILTRQCGRNQLGSALLIMDDCLSKKEIWTSDECNIKNILLHGRTCNLTNIVTAQCLDAIPSELRSNFDYIFILKEDNDTDKEKIWKAYTDIFPSYDEFIEIFDMCTEDYSTMVINNRNRYEGIESNIFWYKANSDHPAEELTTEDFGWTKDILGKTRTDYLSNSIFSFGSIQFKQYHKKFYDPLYIYKLYDPTYIDKKDISNVHKCNDKYSFSCFVNEDKLEKIANESIFSEDSADARVDYLNYFLNNSMDSDLNTLSNSSDSSDSLASTSDTNDRVTDYPNITQPNDEYNPYPVDEIIQFTYNDNSYQFHATIKNLNNTSLIQSLCDHIENVRNSK